MKLKIGDYVLATKFCDGDPGDPWDVGFLNDIKNGRYFVGDKEIRSFRGGGYRHCVLISSEAGKWLLDNAKILESSHPGTLNILGLVSTEANANSTIEGLEQ